MFLNHVFLEPLQLSDQSDDDGLQLVHGREQLVIFLVWVLLFVLLAEGLLLVEGVHGLVEGNLHVQVVLEIVLVLEVQQGLLPDLAPQGGESEQTLPFFVGDLAFDGEFLVVQFEFSVVHHLLGLRLALDQQVLVPLLVEQHRLLLLGRGALLQTAGGRRRQVLHFGTGAFAPGVGAGRRRGGEAQGGGCCWE